VSEGLRILLTTDAVGGVWTYSLDLARSLSRLGLDPILAVMGPSPSAAQIVAARGAAARVIDTGLPLDWTAQEPGELARAGQSLARLAQEVGADLVQLHTPALAGQGVFTLPVVAVHHSCVATWWDALHGGDPPAEFAWRTDCVRAGLAAAHAVVTPTAAFGEQVRRLYRLTEAPVTVHNGRSPLPLPPAGPADYAFTAGRLWDPAKNLATLDAAAARTGLPLYAAGPTEGPNGAHASFGNIRCLGLLDEAEIGRRLAAGPIFVSAARYEPFGLAVLEAAMAGCPLVLSDISTFRELWDGAAVFVPADDAAAFAEAIDALACDESRRSARGRAARERARRFSADAMAAEMVRLYRSVLAAERAPAPPAARVAA
jgi:glycosyltransferase involved in cell wall biosynthesis